MKAQLLFAMKTALIIVWVIFTTAAAFAQGIINFANNPGTLISIGIWPPPVIGPPSLGSYYFALLTAAPGTKDPRQFTFSGLYATNTATAGRFSGGYDIEAPGWAAGTIKSFMVAGWSASLGQNWNQEWLAGNFDKIGFFGLSGIGTDAAGGFFGNWPLPPMNVFGGALGIPSGFSLFPVPAVPEPAAASLAALGVAMLIAYRRNRPPTSR